MPLPNDDSSSPIAVQFLQAFLEDQTNGRRRSLRAYQEQFAGHEDLIAAEFEAIRAPQPENARSSDYPADGGRYRNPVEIGRGGMGRVVRCFDPSLGREVAMKLLAGKDGELPDASVLRRFLHEAKITGQLQHPGIVSVHEIGLNGDGHPYYTMPLLPGTSLLAVIAAVHDGAGNWSRVRALGVLVRVAEAVAHAHARGIIHRDLKPANVMVGENGETFVVDWGVARRLERPPGLGGIDEATSGDDVVGEAMLDRHPETIDGDVLGTPAYMPPEQARGEVDALGRHSDVYSLGAMLYQLLAFRAPFAGADEAPSSRETLAMVLQGAPEPLAKAAVDVPPELVSICERAMARDPQDRYPSAAEFASDLRAFLEDRVVQAHASGTFLELRKWMKRNRVAATAMIGAVAALVVGLGVSLLFKFAADRTAERADNSYYLAVDAVEDLLGQVGWRDLSEEPGVASLRRTLARKALWWFKRLEKARPEIAASHNVALSCMRVGILEGMLGDPEASLDALSESSRIYRQIQELAPSRQIRQSIMYVDGEILAIKGKAGQDTLAAMQALANDARELLAAAPESAPLLSLVDGILAKIMSVLKRKKMLQLSIAVCDERLEIGRRLIAKNPRELATLLSLASTQRARGSLFGALKNHSVAAESFRSAIEHLDAALAMFGGRRDLRYRRCRILNSLGAELMRQKLRAQGIAVFEQCVIAARELAAGYPEVADYQCELAGALNNLGLARGHQKDPVATEDLYLEGRKHVRMALARSLPSAQRNRCATYYGNIVRSLSGLLVDQGRLQECTELLRELREDLPRQPLVTLVAMGTCARNMVGDKSRSTTARAAAAKPLCDEIMEILHASFDSEIIKPSLLRYMAFDALRGREDFQAFEARVGNK